MRDVDVVSIGDVTDDRRGPPCHVCGKYRGRCPEPTDHHASDGVRRTPLDSEAFCRVESGRPVYGR